MLGRGFPANLSLKFGPWCHHSVTLKIPCCEHSVVRYNSESETLWPAHLSFTYIAAETYNRKQWLLNPRFQSPRFIQLHNITCQASHGSSSKVCSNKQDLPWDTSFISFLPVFFISGEMLGNCRKKTKEVWDFMLSSEVNAGFHNSFTETHFIC